MPGSIDTDKILDELRQNYAEAQRAIDDQTVTFFDRTRDYNNTVVTVGYAGFFAIWAFTRDTIPEAASTHVAIAMGISILLFVLFVIIDMLFLTYAALKFARDVKVVADFQTLEEAASHSEAHKAGAIKFQRDVRRAAMSVIVVWPIFFLPSLFLGLYAALLLIYNFLADLTSLPYWPQ